MTLDRRRNQPVVYDLRPSIRGIIGQAVLSKKTITVNTVITAGYTAYFPDECEIANSIELEIGNGGILEIG